MIPQISQAPGVVQLVLNFLQELEQQGFTGDTATSYADRLTMSTDNSIYQLLPDAVVFPRSTADVALIARLAAQERYSSLIFTPRGGGTGNGKPSVIDLHYVLPSSGEKCELLATLVLCLSGAY